LKRLFVESVLCTGCLMCELACSIHKTGLANPLNSRIRVAKNYKTGVNQPVVCRQCNPAPCQEVCPVDCFERNLETGALVLNEEGCIRCGSCVEACPFGALSFSVDGALIKCDLCGGDPRCVKFCKERPENSSAWMANPRASALRYVTPPEASALKREIQLRKAERGEEP